MSPSMRAVVLILLISLLFPVDAVAASTETICPLVGRGLIQIDGLLDDWPPGAEVTKAARDARDASLAVRCAYDETTLYLAVNVKDDRLIRNKGKPEDRLVVGLGDGKLDISPSSGEVDLVWRWQDKKASAKVEVADSLQRAGWSVELSLPLARVPGFARGAPSVSASVDFSDVDQLVGGRVEDTVATGPLALTFEASARTLKAFLDEVHARPADITLDVVADVDGEPGLERIVVARTALGVLSDGFAYLELPVATPPDLQSVQVVDLGGAGKSSFVVHYTERGNIGSRDVLAIWTLRSGAFARIFAHEVAKQLGADRLTNRFELVPRKGKHGQDLVISVGEVRGFTAESWRETPASDMAPILLPWGEKKQEIWHFDRDEVSGG